MAPTQWKLMWPLCRLVMGWRLTLQLAQGYVVLAAHGAKVPVRLLKGSNQSLKSQIFKQAHVDELLQALHHVVSTRGTVGQKCQAMRWRVKQGLPTSPKGMVRKATDMWLLLSECCLARGQTSDCCRLGDPVKGHYGGQVAAPVFSKVAASSMRLLEGAAARGSRLTEQSTLKVSVLLEGIVEVPDLFDTLIQDVTIDSREVVLKLIAIPGEVTDGRDYLKQAVEKGAIHRGGG